MNTIKYSLFLGILLSLCMVKAKGQDFPVRIQVQVAPPYSAYINDYKNKPIISLTNTTQQPYRVFLRGRMENERGQYVQTKPNVYTNIPIDIGPMQTVVLQGNQVDGSYLDVNNLETNLEDEVYDRMIRHGMIPEGFYTFCIYAYSRDNGGNYHPVSDPQANSSCFSFNVSYIAPPLILSPQLGDTISPTPNQNVNITWTRPLGNMQNALLVYDLYVVRAMPGDDPNISLNNAVQYGAGLFFKQTNIPVNNFQFTSLQTGFLMDEGSDYVLMVQARDLNGQAVFENNGRSEMAVFRYGKPIQEEIPIILKDKPKWAAGDCACKVDIASLNKTNATASLQAGGSFKMGPLTINIKRITGGAKASGEGTVNINNIPVQVSFQDVIVNKDGIAIEGTAWGKTSSGFEFLDQEEAALQVSATQYDSFISQITSHNLRSAGNSNGLLLPFGWDAVGKTDELNIGVTALTITPRQASFNAIALMQLADANQVLTLTAKDICFGSEKLLCNDAVFKLGKDLPLPTIHLTLNGYKSDENRGTYALLSQSNNTKQLHINATYNFPVSQITNADGSAATALLATSITSWSDWTANVELSPFKLKALDQALFTPSGRPVYDHSTLRNPAGMPSSFSDSDVAEKNAQIGNALWAGFYMPGVTVALPTLVEDLQRPGSGLTINAHGLILDNQGLTGIINANDIVNVENGSLGGWHCSVDKITLKILNSTYKTGGLYGKLVLPFSNKDKPESRIDYSCTLSTSEETGQFTYQFVTQQQNKVDVSAWWAYINITSCGIEVTRNTTTNTTTASADISGGVSFLEENINSEIDLYSIAKPTLQEDFSAFNVEHLVVQTQAPYAKLEKTTTSSSLWQTAMSKFPISITDAKGMVNAGAAGLQFTFNLKLSDVNNKLLPNATGTFTIEAKLPTGGEQRPLWGKGKFLVDKLTVAGNLAGILTIKEGNLEFFRNDPKFGNGIRGNLDVRFAGLEAVKIEAGVGAVFGNTVGNDSYNYWFFDASVKLPVAIVVAPGISINGFGGGAWYNMKRMANENITARDYFQNMHKYEVGAYLPHRGTLGFKAKLGVCTNDGFIFSGFGELGMTFDNSNGFSVHSLNGTVYGEMLAAVKDHAPDDNAPITGVIDWHIGIADEVYSLKGNVKLKYPVQKPTVTGQGILDLLSDGKGNWHIKIGEPGKRNELSIAGLIDFKSYMMAGNNINASIPDPDPAIVNVADIKGYQKLNYNPDGGGLVMGASMKMDLMNINYLIFYLKVSFGLGYDVSLARYTAGCNPGEPPPGLNGWYATGQVYAKIAGDFGLEVDLFFYKGKISAAKVGAGLLLQGGLPNPYWFNGVAFLEYSVLDGAVKGNINFKVSFGEVKECIPAKEVFTQPLMAKLLPEHGSKKVKIFAKPEAAFNYPVETDFDLITQDKEDRSIERRQTFRLEIDKFTVTDLERNRLYASYNDPDSHPVFLDDAHSDLVLTPASMMEPLTRHKAEVMVKAKRMVGEKWEYENHNGKPVEQYESAEFETGECKLDEIISNSRTRLGAYPFPNQRYFLTGESKQGAIFLEQAPRCNRPDDNFDLLVRFTVLKNKNVVSTAESPIQYGGGRYLSFDIPSLPNEHLVRVEVIKRLKLSPMALWLSSMEGSPATDQGGYIRIMHHPKQKYLTNTDIVLYKYHFRTSRYNTMNEKLNTMYYSGVQSYDPGGQPVVLMKTVEHFDKYDVEGFQSDRYGGGQQVFFTLPLVSLKETSDYSANKWLSNHEKPYFYEQIRAAGLSVNEIRNTSQIHYKDLLNFGIANDGSNYYGVPLRPISIRSYDPPLSWQDILQDESMTELYGLNSSFIISNKFIKLAQ